ncbi:hypothetical protein GCM10011363_22480 [Marivita lacus]|uniref:TIGR04255 family protein n=1 Tax=Marivita lacus TaxID=1323742 RepID=A0ABQ1KP19_9RHOB|nr:TIGR04255 family protein [Marivita lacus]GGC05256.1 hypothetical protein GCM10011363_22480 [Marivita lacus]
MSDYVYEKPPLVEVILEIHWALKPLGSAPNAAIDPYYDLFRESFLEAVSVELPVVEQLVPSEIPVEFVSDQPHLRLRPKKSGWPLIQIGPGVMTVNIVPPYAGWAEFRSFVSWALDALLSAYPMAEKTFKPKRGHLRYIDVFDARFGFDSFKPFVETHFGAVQPVRQQVVDEISAEPERITFSVDSNFSVKSPANATFRFRIAPGIRDGQEAVVMEFHCDGEMSNGFLPKEELESWFDEAHATLNIAFDKTVSDALKARFGKAKEIS